jgi:hypothetical protein
MLCTNGARQALDLRSIQIAIGLRWVAPWERAAPTGLGRGCLRRKHPIEALDLGALSSRRVLLRGRSGSSGLTPKLSCAQAASELYPGTEQTDKSQSVNDIDDWRFIARNRFRVGLARQDFLPTGPLRFAASCRGRFHFRSWAPYSANQIWAMQLTPMHIRCGG